MSGSNEEEKASSQSKSMEEEHETASKESMEEFFSAERVIQPNLITISRHVAHVQHVLGAARHLTPGQLTPGQLTPDI